MRESSARLVYKRDPDQITTTHHPFKDTRVWATCPACRGHKKQADPEHTLLEDECIIAPKHIKERRRGAKAGTLAPLENDNDEHGAPLALDQETALYTNESEDVVRPEQIANLNPPRQDPRYVDPEEPTPPPPPHPRHLARQQVENIMEEASTRAFDEDTPSWSTFDIGTAMTS